MQTNEPISNPDQQISSPQPTNTPAPQQQPSDASSSVQESTQGKKSNKWLIIGLGILTLVVLGIAGVFAYQNYQLKKRVEKPSPNSEAIPTKALQPTPTSTISAPSPTPTTDPTADWEIYENKNYGFSLRYPDNFKVHNLIEKPFYTLEDPIAFGIVLTQDIYVNLAQTPVIKVQLVQTDKTIDQILDQLKTGIENAKEGMADPEHTYYGANPPKINSIEVVQTGSIEVTKVERYQGPGAPHAEKLEYYIKSPNYVFILTARYGTYNPDVDQDGTLEKEVLSKILSTFKFTN